jgi:cell wall assembly regulator SMI1
MNTTAEKYISGLKNAYLTYNADKEWEHFEKIKHGADKKDIEKLKSIYPDIPDALISLFEYVDGTYWREYAGEKITFYFLGSDVEEYPYYLLSSKEIIENQHQAVDYYSDFIAGEYHEVQIDPRIADQPQTLNWLHFSDCMNNGGTSQLYIDFSPSDKGKTGQIVRYLHDPDQIAVIADSFEEYLQMLMDNEYDFINEDVVD